MNPRCPPNAPESLFLRPQAQAHSTYQLARSDLKKPLTVKSTSTTVPPGDPRTLNHPAPEHLAEARGIPESIDPTPIAPNFPRDNSISNQIVEVTNAHTPAKYEQLSKLEGSSCLRLRSGGLSVVSLKRFISATIALDVIRLPA